MQDPSDFYLVDDGTLDTVIQCPNGEEYRYSDTSEYRDLDGTLDLERFVQEVVIPEYEDDVAVSEIWLHNTDGG